MSTLGELIRTTRELKDLAPGAVAKSSEISTAYLSKLERGEVGSPSPHILYRLAGALDLPYAELMRTAGYVVPGEGPRGRKRAALAFDADDLSDDEIEELETYLAWYRQRQRRSGAG